MKPIYIPKIPDLIIPHTLRTDSYKLSHWKQYPKGTTRMVSYFESRGGEFENCTLFGLKYVLNKYLANPVTQKDVDFAASFAFLHGEPFNQKGWDHIVNKYEGRLPVKIRAIKEGTVVPTRNCILTIECDDPECFWIVSWPETMLVRLWYPSTIAMASRESKKILIDFFKETSDMPLSQVLFKLHDFGARGVTCEEQAMLGGAAHLASFLGSDTIEGILLANHYYNIEMSGFSIPACYDDETEILTKDGFIPFSELTDESSVAQYHENGNIDFANPSKIHSGNFKGSLITFSTKGDVGAIDCVVTPNHRMVRRSIATEKIEVLQASDFNVSHRNVIPQAGNGIGSKKQFTELDALRFAFQADGSFVSRSDSYNGTKTGCKPIRFSLKKERKQNRLREICSALNFEFSESKVNDYIHFWVKIPLELDFVKDLSWIDLSEVSTEWCQAAIHEISKWDGQKKYNTFMYHSSDYQCASIVQGIGVLANWRSSLSPYEDPRGDRKTQYTVCICSDTNSRNGQGVQKGTVEYNGKVYCVTVPSGMLIVRRNGNVIISGNSEHSTVSMWGRYKEHDMYKNYVTTYLANVEKPEGIPKLAACVSDTYNVYQACEWWSTGKLKEIIKNSGGTIIVRPDSGDPLEVLPKMFEIFARNLSDEITVNSKGYRVLPPWIRVIQGDGIDRQSMKEICRKLTELKWSIDNIAFGSGGGLLQKVNRDTQKWAFKCCYAEINGVAVDVRKDPITDPGKQSKEGRLDLVLKDGTYQTVKLDDGGFDYHEDSVMELVFDCGYLTQASDTQYADVREGLAVEGEWEA